MRSLARYVPAAPSGRVTFFPEPSTWVLVNASVRQVFAELDASYKDKRGQPYTSEVRRFILSAISLKFDALVTYGFVRLPEEPAPEAEKEDAEETSEEDDDEGPATPSVH